MARRPLAEGHRLTANVHIVIKKHVEYLIMSKDHEDGCYELMCMYLVHEFSYASVYIKLKVC